MLEVLGKIKRITLGKGGYQDACFGLSVELSMATGNVADFKGSWCPARMKHRNDHKWTEADRDDKLSELMRRIASMLKDAKVDYLHELEGSPVMVTMDGQILESWRILTEVM